MRFYTASKLGSKRSLTPEGFLVCRDVPIARTGEMLYAPDELPGLDPGRDGLIRVQRDPAEVFRPEAMASFVGKPTTNDHPPDQVGPENFRLYAAGSVQNVRQGQGIEADLLIADLIWWDPEAIAAIDAGKDEISCGYDAEYEPQDTPGIARQVNISGNHVALVDSGRCGSRCAIGDSAAALQTTPGAEQALARIEAPSCGCGGGHRQSDRFAVAKPARRKVKDKMATKKVKGSAWDRMRRAFASKDEAGFEEALGETQEIVESNEEEAEKAEFASMIGEAVASAIAPVVERLDAVEAVTNDLKSRGRDSAPANMGTAESGNAAEGDPVGQGAGGGSSAPPAATDPGDYGDMTGAADNEAVAAYLKAKGLSDEDIAEVCKMVGATPTTDDPGMTGTQSGGADDPSDRFANGDPGYMGQGMGTDDEESEEEKAKAAKTTADAANFSVVFRDAVSRAEVLAPGVGLPTYDGKATKKAMQDAVCALRRKALKAAFDSADRKAHVAPFVTDAAPDFTKMSCGAVKMIFTGASELAKAANKTATRDAAADDLVRTRDQGTRLSIKAINDANAAFWSRGK